MASDFFMSEKTLLMSASALERALTRIAHEIAERNDDDPSGICVVGIQRGGVALADRLGALLSEILGRKVEVGYLDVAMFRDDLGSRPAPEIAPTMIPFDCAGRTVALVDDVLYSGRTTRAALDGIMQRGRPRRVQLAVLIDRAGHRELPIEPNFIGKRQETQGDERIDVQLTEKGGRDEVYLTNP